MCVGCTSPCDHASVNARVRFLFTGDSPVPVNMEETNERWPMTTGDLSQRSSDKHLHRDGNRHKVAEQQMCNTFRG